MTRTLQAISALRIGFERVPELVGLYRKAGNELPTLNGNGRWALSVPATSYVTDQQGPAGIIQPELMHIKRQ